MRPSKHKKISKMSSSEHRKMPSCNFPEDILAEILKRLPVKYVLRCRSVQKSWYRLVKTPMFIALHLNYQKILATRDSSYPKYLFFLNMRDHLLTVRFDDVQCQEYGTFKYPLDLPDHALYTLANGLICVTSMFNDSVLGCRYNFNQGQNVLSRLNVLSHGTLLVSSMFDRTLHYDPNIYLWNPLVQKYKTLPDSPISKYTSQETCWKALAFGFLPEVNDYVVVHIVKPLLTSRSEADSHSVMIGVYSLNTNSWKKTSQDNVSIGGICSNVAVFNDGVAYWVAVNTSPEYGKSVMCFDTKCNILRKIMLDGWNEPVIHPFGRSIGSFAGGNERNYLYMDVLKYNESDEHYWETKMSGMLSENVRGKVLGVRKEQR